MPVSAAAQTQPRPPVKGRYKLKIDSSPQQAAVYWDSSAGQQPKLYGIAGYTPITIKVPKGAVKIVLELSGFKPFEQVLDVRKNTTISPTLERAPRVAKLNLQASADGAGGDVTIDGVPRGTIPNTFELSAGRHQIEVRKAGRKPFSDWVELQEGEFRTRDVSLESAEAPTGTLLVNSDA
ncbi:MAG TPA: PEGA domain-containing protein, partial [Polyangia bacterium]|nr:PEGA domain-containing protein [Polyangia bacterium]